VAFPSAASASHSLCMASGRQPIAKHSCCPAERAPAQHHDPQDPDHHAKVPQAPCLLVCCAVSIPATLQAPMVLADQKPIASITPSSEDPSDMIEGGAIFHPPRA